MTLIETKKKHNGHSASSSTSENSSSGVADDGATWSHATNSQVLLTHALSNPMIESIECDVLLGRDVTSGNSETAILAHPPSRESDLSVLTFLGQVTKTPEDSEHQKANRRVLQKHIKLDFKQLEALEPTMAMINQLRIANPLKKNIFLNADILPGPGNRRNNHVPATAFLQSCLSSISSTIRFLGLPKADEPRFILSLGYKVGPDSDAILGYSVEDVNAMKALIFHYKLEKATYGVVLALNARILHRNLSIFDDLLQKYPSVEILAWTGAGEEDIPKHVVDGISQHFRAVGIEDQVSFDVSIAKGSD